MKLRAERKAGEMLEILERGGGGDRRSDDFQKGNVADSKSEYRRVLEESKTEPTEARRWQTIAGMEEEKFEEGGLHYRGIAGKESCTKRE